MFKIVYAQKYALNNIMQSAYKQCFDNMNILTTFGTV